MHTFDNVPDELRSLPQWVIWGISDSRPKIPYSPRMTSPAEADNPSTWGTFDEAVMTAERKDCGIGFEFGNPAGYAGIDIDHCIHDDGTLSDMAAEIVRLMDSYTELSPSGKGLHILFKLKVAMSEIGNRKKNDRIGLEIYDTGRYFTVTGNVYGEAKPLAERTEAVKQVYSLYMSEGEKEKVKAQPLSPVEASRTPSTELSDSELWERMFDNPENGREIQALYNGDLSGYESHSQADLALCNHLAYWTGNNAYRIDSMFRQSGLMREKWDERHGAQTYGAITIDRAQSGTPTYTPTVKNTGMNKQSNSQQASSTVEAQSVNASTEERRTVAYYLNDFLVSLMKSREGKAISTGFSQLDSLLDGGLYPGLYSLGAISSLGKTTFLLQIADNIARNGQGVLIFSLEMSRFELMAKTISRESFVKDITENHSTRNAQTTRGILRALFRGNPEAERIVLEAVKDYEQWGENLTIIEGIGNVGVDEIKAEVHSYMTSHEGKPPVVVIDYLQILSPADVRASDKQNIDRNVTELKRLSRDYQIPVIGISSFNRENYNSPVSMTSFKESGAIEYSSDVLIGLQYEGADYREGESENERKARIRMLIDQVKASTGEGKTVPIEAKILKNRNGRTGKVKLEFMPMFNYFKEIER